MAFYQVEMIYAHCVKYEKQGYMKVFFDMDEGFLCCYSLKESWSPVGMDKI